MKCPECSKEINDNAKFCKYCGKKIEDNNTISEIPEETIVEEPLFITCPNCGKEMQANKAFCTNCGNPLTETTAKEDVSGEEKKDKPKKKHSKVIILLIVLLLIGGVGFATTKFFKSNDNKSDKVVEKTDEDDEEDGEDKEEPSDDEDKEEPSDDEDKETATEEETDSEIDVEDEIAEIREIYNSIVSGMEKNDYKKKTIENGFDAYSDDNVLKSIVISKEYSQINYNCFYYFDNDKLVFAYYEGENSHRFYFKDDKMIRWRKCEDAENSDEGINHDMEDSAEYLQWESTVLQNAKVLKLAWNAAGTLEGGEEYILPGSDTRIITKSDLEGLTKEEVKLARNEIYARHGRKFDDESLKAYFSQFDWYHPTIEPEDFEESMLNNYEVANRDFIVAYEEE